MKLTREQRGELDAAIRDAFDPSELEKLLEDELDVKLYVFVDPGKFSAVVHDLIGVFDRHGTVDQLVRAVAKERPKNPLVQRYVQRHGGLPPPVPAARSLPVPPQPYIAHPYTLLDVDQFVGRRDELERLDRWVARTDPETADVGLIVLHAIGGAGKSSLTWEWFGRQAGRPWAGRMWWSFYAQEATFAAFAVSALCYLTRQSRDEMLKRNVEDRLDLLCQTLNDSPHLIVLDGFERVLVAYAPLDAQYAEGDASQVSLRRCIDPQAGEFLKRVRTADKSRVLMTTRLIPAELLRLTGDVLPHCRDIPLEVLQDADALALWRQYDVSGSDELLLSYFRTFKSHPLLIRALAGAVAHCRTSCRDFDTWRVTHPDFNPFQLDLKQARSHILQFALRGLDAPAQTLLQHIAAFRMPITFPVLSSLLVGVGRPFTIEAALDQQLAVLEERGLVGWDSASGECDMHPVVRGVTWAAVDPTRQGEICDHHFRFFERDELRRSRYDRITSIEQLTYPLEMVNLLLRQKKYEAAAELWNNRITLPTAKGEVTAPQMFADLLMQFFPNGTSQPCSVPSKEGTAIGQDLSLALDALGRVEEALPLDIARARDCPCYACLTNVANSLSSLGRLYDAELGFRQAMPEVRKTRSYLTKVGEADHIIVASIMLLDHWHTRGVAGVRISDQLHKFRNQKDHREEWTAHELPLAQYVRFTAYHNLSFELALDAGEYDIANYHADRLSAGGRVQGDERLILRAARKHGRIALARGDETIALERFRFVQAEARKTGSRIVEVGALLNLARLQLKAKKFTAARGHVEEVLLFADSTQLRRLQAEANVLLAEVEQADNRRDEAVRLAEKAYRLAWCDGPPFAAAKPLADAEKVLVALGASLPQMPPFDPTGREPLPEVKFPC